VWNQWREVTEFERGNPVTERLPTRRIGQMAGFTLFSIRPETFRFPSAASAVFSSWQTPPETIAFALLWSNHHYMITEEQREKLRGWFAGRLPDDLFESLVEVTVDREEITVIGRIPEPRLAEGASAAEKEEDVAARVQEFRERTREDRVAVAREAEHRFRKKVSWGVECDGERALFTHVAAPVMTRLRQPERQVLDTLIAAGVARSRSDALAWCVRLVGQHEEDWLAELRAAMESVADVRGRGPAA
jgi:hypothetical protein